MSTRTRKIGVTILWLCIWVLIAACVNNRILMVGPWETVTAFGALLKTTDFYLGVGLSLMRIALGFAGGFLMAQLLAYISFRLRFVEEFLAPMITLMKTIPMASFVVVLLIWWGPEYLSTVICFLVVFPNLYISTLQGLHNADGKLLEVAQVFGLPGSTRYFYIYRDALKPFLLSSMKLSLGMCWKAGIAAELIGVPEGSIGEKMYLTKVYLDVPGLFAWTLTIVLVSMAFEKLVLWLTEWMFTRQPACKEANPQKETADRVVLEHVCKRYDDTFVLEDWTAVYEKDNTYYLDTPSGSGKTTLLRILAGLTKPDCGQLQVPGACAMVFQEDRLFEAYDAVKNVEMVLGDREKAEAALLKLLAPEDIGKPCQELSGGMKRRVALVRAMEARAELVLLDEPFTGMDEVTRERVEAYIAEKKQGKILIIATHI